METQKQEAKLVNPPKETHMVAKGSTVRMVKVVALKPFQVGKLTRDAGGEILEDTTRIVQVGEMVQVTEKQAQDLLKPMQGAYSFSGERHNVDGDVTRHDMTRARRATAADLVPHADKELPVEEVQES